MSMEAWDDDGNICDPEDWGGMGGMPSNDPWEPSLPEDDPNWRDWDREDWLERQAEEEERFYEKIKGLEKNISSRKKGKVEDTLVLGHEAKDLGLSVKWASCNIGAEKPSDYGDYFAWEEIEPKSEYTKNNCKYGCCTFTESSIEGSPILDAARANWHGTWRSPTEEEIKELIDNCTWEWTAQGWHNGIKITGPNGNSIFLPAAGMRYGTSLDYAGAYGHYWSATPNEKGMDNACSLEFYSDLFSRCEYCHNFGQSVRPVSR